MNERLLRQAFKFLSSNEFWSKTIVKSFAGSSKSTITPSKDESAGTNEFSRVLTDDLLEKVNRPGQYLGNEWGARHKPFDAAEVRLALTFPDLYELGMSNFGLKILYQIVNNRDNFLADRAYAPDSDLEKLLRERNLPLWGWECRRPLNQFELVGFSLQYELTYTNVLNMLELSHIPVRANDRVDIFPLVFGGGPSAVNPEPMAPFMDFFIIGDGEKALPAVMQVVAEWKSTFKGNQEPQEARRQLLARVATEVPGVYVPLFYQAQPNDAFVKPISNFSDDPRSNCRSECSGR